MTPASALPCLSLPRNMTNGHVWLFHTHPLAHTTTCKPVSNAWYSSGVVQGNGPCRIPSPHTICPCKSPTRP